MMHHNSKLLAFWLILAVGAAVADDSHLCGTSSTGAEDAPQLLDDEFRSLLHPSAMRTEQKSLSKNDGVVKSKSAPSARTARMGVAPECAVRPVTKKLLPRTCVLRDPSTERELLTLKIPGSVSAEQISADELAARREAEQSMQRLPQQPAKMPRYQNDSRPRLMIRRDAQTSAIHVDAHSSDVRDVLEGISSRTGKRILFHPELEGTISTKTSAEGIIVLIRTMLEPFNFSVVATANELIVCGPSETPGGVLAAIAKTREAKQPANKAVAEAVQLSPSSIAPELSPIPRPGQKTVPPQRKKVIQLATAQLKPAASPSTKARALFQKPMTTEELAAERIARVAQDAFAVGQTQYATEVLQQGLKLFPASPMLQRILGESLYLDGKFPDAAKALASAIALDKRDPMANELMGKTLKALGQKERAYHYLLQAQQSRKAAR